jgi:hypothetical protein
MLQQTSTEKQVVMCIPPTHCPSANQGGKSQYLSLNRTYQKHRPWQLWHISPLLNKTNKSILETLKDFFPQFTE